MMRAMVLDRPGTALVMRERPLPQPQPGEILIETAACGVCRTDADPLAKRNAAHALPDCGHRPTIS